MYLNGVETPYRYFYDNIFGYRFVGRVLLIFNGDLKSLEWKSKIHVVRNT